MDSDKPPTPVGHTPGPWHTCNKAECSCFTVMSDHHPVAQVTHGDWGDDFPAIRLVGRSSLDQKAEAYMEQFTYGSVGEDRARANWRLIAAAPDLLDALKGLLDFVEIDKLKVDPRALQIARAAVIKAEEGLQ